MEIRHSLEDRVRMRLIKYRDPAGTLAWGQLDDGDRIVGRQDLALGDVELLAPYEGGRIFCAAVNYADHRAEMARDATEKPMLFMRAGPSIVGPGAALIKPTESDQYDFEGELAVVIGAAGRRIARSDALAHVHGYACFMDGTMRDWQRHTAQFTPGKNFDASGAMGPWILPRDAFGDYKRQALTTRLNGDIVQQTAIDLMLFDVETLIEYISTFTRLVPGDVIATGTCGGVGAKRTPPLFMRPGDRIEVEVSGLGVLSNAIAAEPFGA
jgi:2-keto-4-pentenoate hydratase/2-oxohepta-3-ene-1,7-dioic acid hydratase in catechol pathway